MKTFHVALLFAFIALPALATAQSKSEATPKKTTTEAPAAKEQTKTKAAAQTKTIAPAKKETFELTFDDLSFEMKKGSKFKRSMLTEKINSYHNNTVKLRGYIRPSFKQSGLAKFIFVRDNKECCFGGNAAIFDNVLVKLTKGTKTDFTVRPVTIEGRMYLKEYKGPDGRVWSIYRMSDAKMR